MLVSFPSEVYSVLMSLSVARLVNQKCLIQVFLVSAKVSDNHYYDIIIYYVYTKFHLKKNICL